MKNSTSIQSLLAVICIAASSTAVAANTVLLRCSVTGVYAVDGNERQVAETLDVEVNEGPLLTVDLAGRDVRDFLASRDLQTEDNKITAKNMSHDREWYLVNNTTSLRGETSTDSSVRINRVSGAFTYIYRMRLTPDRLFKVEAFGTCSKQTAKPKF